VTALIIQAERRVGGQRVVSDFIVRSLRRQPARGEGDTSDPDTPRAVTVVEFRPRCLHEARANEEVEAGA